MSQTEIILAECDWQEAEKKHELLTKKWVEGRLSRQMAGEKHPVEDFLFNYYRFRPSYLQRWSPGLGVVISGSDSEKFLARRYYSRHSEGVWLDPKELPPHRHDGLKWAIFILRATLSRESQYGCFGLHEWAMVYKAEQRRHEEMPLRMAPDALAEFVESQRICCSHYDAFRFFTTSGRPLNTLQPRKESQPELEQGGCLHTNMDLYKWAFKFSPWVPSELLAETFFLARRIREIDMRASPYDLRSLGYEPIPIETSEGRQEYDRWQRLFAEEARPLRQKLLAVLELLRQPLPERTSENTASSLSLSHEDENQVRFTR